MSVVHFSKWHPQQYKCCCQVVWKIRTLGIKIFLFNISINLFRSWHTIVKNKLIRISLFFMNVRQLRNKFMLMWNKNIFILHVRICQTTWQQQKFQYNIEIRSKKWKPRATKIRGSLPVTFFSLGVIRCCCLLNN